MRRGGRILIIYLVAVLTDYQSVILSRTIVLHEH